MCGFSFYPLTIRAREAGAAELAAPA